MIFCTKFNNFYYKILIMQKESFKKQYTKEQRLRESENILKHYQDRVPIIIEKDRNSRLPDLDV